MVCLKNAARTFNVGALTCDSGSAESISLQALLDKYNVWRSAKMIISNTAGLFLTQQSIQITKIVLMLDFRDSSEKKGLDKPQCIGCQRHILDLVLRHLLDSLFPINSVT